MNCYLNPETGKPYKDADQVTTPSKVRARSTREIVEAASLKHDDMATPVIQRIGDIFPSFIKDITPNVVKTTLANANISIIASPVDRAYAFYNTVIGNKMPTYNRIMRLAFQAMSPSVTGIGHSNQGALSKQMSLAAQYIDGNLIQTTNEQIGRIKLEYAKEGRKLTEADRIELQTSLWDARTNNTRFPTNGNTPEHRINAIKNEMLDTLGDLSEAMVKMAQTAGAKDANGVGRGITGFSKEDIKPGTERQYMPQAWDAEQLHKLLIMADGNTDALVASFTSSVYSAFTKAGKYITFRRGDNDFVGSHIRMPTAEDLAAVMTHQVMQGDKGKTLFHNAGLDGNGHEVINAVRSLERGVMRNGLMRASDLTEEYINGQRVVKLGYSSTTKQVEISPKAMKAHTDAVERVAADYSGNTLIQGDYVYAILNNKGDGQNLATSINRIYNQDIDKIFGVTRDANGEILTMSQSRLIDLDSPLVVNGEHPQTGATVNLAEGLAFKDLLHKDTVSTSIAAFHQIIGRTALADEFARITDGQLHIGSRTDFNSVINAMKEAFNQEIANIAPDQLESARHAMSEQINDLNYLYDRLTGKAVGVTNTPEWMIKGARITSKVLQLQLLGKAGLSAVTEFSKIAAYNGVFRSVALLAKIAARERQSVFSETATKTQVLSQLQILVGNSRHTLDNSIRSHIQAGETSSMDGRFEKMLFKGNQFQNKWLSFMNPVTDMLEHTANAAILGKITDIMVEVGKLRDSNGAISEEKLRSVFKNSRGNWSDWRYVQNYLGVSEKEMDNLLRNFERNTKINRQLSAEGVVDLDLGIESIGDYYDGKHHINYKQGHSWDDDAIYTLTKIVAREGRKTVQQNVAGEAPRFLDNPIGRLVFSMYQFAAVAYSKQFLTDLTYFNKSVMTAWTMEVMMLLAINSLRDKTRNNLDARDPRIDEDELLQQYLNAGGRALSMNSAFGLPLTAVYDTTQYVIGGSGLGGGDPRPIPTPMIMLQLGKASGFLPSYYKLMSGEQITGTEAHNAMQLLFGNSVPEAALEKLISTAARKGELIK